MPNARYALREVVMSVDGLSLDTFSLAHPVLGPINGYQWFLFIGSHEARHAAQITEIAGEIAT